MTTVTPVSRLDDARRLVAKSGSSFKEAIRAIGEAFAPAPIRSEMPVPKPVTDAQRAAVGKLLSVFGSVAPTSRRELDTQEQRALIEERTVIGDVEKMVTKRKEDIADIVHVHLDIEAERLGLVGADTPVHPKRGFYILPGEISVPGGEKTLKREPRDGSASLPLPVLRQMEAAGEISHEDLLAVTVPTREFDEHRFMIWLKKHPEMMEKLGPWITYVGKTAAVSPR